jgi:cell division inhibitor SepF
MSALQKLKAYFGMVPADDDLYDADYRDEYENAPASYEDSPTRSRSRYHAAEDAFDDESPARARARNRGTSEPAVHGALAMEHGFEPISRLRPVTETVVRSSSRDPLSRITTLHPTNFDEARAIGEHYRDGAPVIINLTEMNTADAKRVVDFAAGLAFSVRGSMDRVTNKVFLLSPPDVDVTAEDRRRIAEGGFFLRS